MPIDRSIIDATLRTPYGERAYKVVEQLTDAGHDTWWVGGGVRDMLTGKIPADIDIATAAKPEEVERLFGRVDRSAAELGSVRVTVGPDTFEVTTFRIDDAASDGRHPESIAFGTREEDAERRDLTINALYFQPISRELYDPFGGEGDLKERLIRLIGDPKTRIEHDALRIFRAIRFRALLDGQYHPDTYRALHECAPLVRKLSGQRVLEELEKLLKGPNPARGLEDQWELDVLEQCIPELSRCKGVAQPADYHREGDVWDHTLQAVSALTAEDTADVRLAILFHDIGKAETFSRKERIRFDEHASVSGIIAETVLNRLNCPAKRREKIVWLVKHHMMMGTFFEIDESRKSRWYHHPWFPELLRLFQLDIAGTTPADYGMYEKILADYHRFLDSHPRPQKPLLTGHQVMEILHLSPGERVGEILQALHDAQARGEVRSRQEAVAFLERQRDG